MSGIRVLACGGRDWRDRGFVIRQMSWIARTRGPIGLLIQGGAPGADTFAKDWAENNGINTETFQADWREGPKAGPLRNQRMLELGQPDLVVAFPGGRGTADMVRRSKAAGVEVIEVAP